MPSGRAMTGKTIARHALMAGLTAIGCLAAAASRADGDAAAGRELAVEWCSRCHDVGADGRMKQEPPSFAAIAVYRSADQIRSHIIAPHGAMPETAQILGLDLDDLVAYITSLEPPAE